MNDVTPKGNAILAQPKMKRWESATIPQTARGCPKPNLQEKGIGASIRKARQFHSTA